MGDNGHHRPESRFQELAPALEARGVELKYTDRMEDLNSETLNDFDGLVLYANIDRIEDSQAKAVLDYVASGKGFIPLHCATYCWRNNKDMVALMGAQFQRHGGQVFTTQIAEANHPVMKGYGSFTSWDETYIHHLHNEENRTVLEYRVEGDQADGNDREPWTWVRTHGKGRVFYTAWGHDQRTFTNPGFHNLVERGIRWACGNDPSSVPAFTDPNTFAAPAVTKLPDGEKPFKYVDVGPKIPNYTPGRQWGVQGKPRTEMQLPLSPEESMKRFVTPEGMAVRLYADERDFGTGVSGKALAAGEKAEAASNADGPAASAVGSPSDALGKPIAMNWDERGRLWICETLDYPNELGRDRDRIRICEDTDGDHVADKFTIFAEGLSIPTAIVIYRGGAVVQNGTETIYLKDTDGDDKADVRETLITGWALGDTHGGVSNFRYGLDNWIWGMQGYNNSSPKLHRPDGSVKETQSFRMGFFRFKLSPTDGLLKKAGRPDQGQLPAGAARTPEKVTFAEPTSNAENVGRRSGTPVRSIRPTSDFYVEELEFIRSSDNNTWGLGISEDGLIFGSTANHNPSMFMPIPNRYYESVRGWAPQTLHSIADTYKFKPITENIRQVDQFGGYTAGAGHALYTARTFPQQWWNKTAFVCGPTGHLVGTFVLRRDGANYKSTSPVNLLASDDEWSAPIMAEVGPDGAVWVLDWYNYIVQHNPTPQGFETGKGNAYESDLRDKKHGRIYRVVPTSDDGDTVHSFLNLADADNEQLVEALKHPSFMWRLTAQRLLIERDAGRTGKLLQPLLKLLGDDSVDEIGLNVGAIHALHTLKGIGYGSLDRVFLHASVIEFALDRSLAHPSAAVRRNSLAFLATDPGQHVTDDHKKNSLALVLRHPELFVDADTQVRLQAFLTLADLSDDNPQAIEPILDSINTTSSPVLLDAIIAAATVHGQRQLARVTESGSNAALRIGRRVAEHIGRSRPER